MKIAIIGGGIAGLSAAYLLHPYHQITVYEQAASAGGHSRTCSLPTADGDVAVDTGFIVYNHRNYPNLSALFDRLHVPVAKSKMSFGISLDQGRYEYCTANLAGLFAQPSNLVQPTHWRMLRDIIRFNRQAKAYSIQHPQATLGDCLSDLKLSAGFRQHYLFPMSGAIWSTSAHQIQQMPAKTLIRFFDNHGLLTINRQPQWYTVRGGSQTYVQKLIAGYRSALRYNSKVVQVARTSAGVNVTTADGDTSNYDQVILACHSDQALHIIQAPTAAERAVLGAIRYQPNQVVLHSDQGFMPRRRRAWASWVYLADSTHAEPNLSLTYWMNNLQPLGTDQPILVTLNPSQLPDPALIYDTHRFSHPLFDAAAIAAQARLPEIQGHQGIWFCGAWQGYGFHEDGLVSAMAVAQQLGAQIPWA